LLKLQERVFLALILLATALGRAHCPWAKDTAGKCLHGGQDSAPSLSCLLRTLSQPSRMRPTAPSPPSRQPCTGAPRLSRESDRHGDASGRDGGLGAVGCPLSRDASAPGTGQQPTPIRPRRRGCQTRLPRKKHPNFHPSSCREEVLGCASRPPPPRATHTAAPLARKPPCRLGPKPCRHAPR